MKKINNRGFSHLEMLIVLLVVAALGFVGFRVIKTSQAGNTCSGQTYGYYNEPSGYGSTGTCVKSIQQIVNSLTGSKLIVDGLYGPLTKAAVTNLQKTAFPNDKTQWDGIVGAKTWSKLCTLTPAKTDSAYQSVQKSACSETTTTKPATTTTTTTPATTTTTTTKPATTTTTTTPATTTTTTTASPSATTVGSYIASNKFLTFKTQLGNVMSFSYGELKGITIKNYNINNGSLFVNTTLFGLSTPFDSINLLNTYKNSSSFTNSNSRNDGGGKYQNWNAIGVLRETCSKNKTCTQGVLTTDQAYELACGELYMHNPVVSVREACDEYKKDQNIINAFYGLIEQYNIAAKPLLGSNTTVLTATELNSLSNAITKILNNMTSYKNTVVDMETAATNLNFGIMNKLNGNDYLNAYKALHKEGFCVSYTPNSMIKPSTENHKGYSLDIGTSSKSYCQTWGKELGGRSVWWNNSKPVAAYGW